VTPKHTPLTPSLAPHHLNPPFSCAGATSTQFETTTATPEAPVGAHCGLCGQKLVKPIILTWRDYENFVWKHCTDSKVAFNGAKHAMQADFPGGNAAWVALQAQMKKYAEEKNAAKEAKKAPKK
jgi:hypothetical protein